MEKYYKVTDVENMINKLLSDPQYQHPDEDFYCGVTGVETALISIPCYELPTSETSNQNKDNLIKELFNDIAEAPTGGVDENFKIRPLKDQLSDWFIRILAGHLVANGWVKEDK